MYLTTANSGFYLGDAIFQIFFLSIVLAIIIGAISLVVSFIKRGKRLERLESKVDKLVKDNERNQNNNHL
ncbi:hypothetical protein [Salimicrobium flavidum]|uniref:Uncharacterized protein n=1 Tax=Salimicrobium flavidum TaxID=570947 RepID=A0A1N7J850_9BACI|nr:hypothetical protein [Salimicrobium flavidum]SIS45548.1 hypothetical protein SAMN05421687_104126 [Salimicrobium flavidum]